MKQKITLKMTAVPTGHSGPLHHERCHPRLSHCPCPRPRADRPGWLAEHGRQVTDPLGTTGYIEILDLVFHAVTDVLVRMRPSYRHRHVHQVVHLRRVGRLAKGGPGRMQRRTSRCSLVTNARRAASFHSATTDEPSSVSVTSPAPGSCALTRGIRKGRADQYQARAAPARSRSVPVRRYSSSANWTRPCPNAFRAGSMNCRLKLGSGSWTAVLSSTPKDSSERPCPGGMRRAALPGRDAPRSGDHCAPIRRRRRARGSARHLPGTPGTRPSGPPSSLAVSEHLCFRCCPASSRPVPARSHPPPPAPCPLRLNRCPGPDGILAV